GGGGNAPRARFEKDRCVTFMKAKVRNDKESVLSRSYDLIVFDWDGTAVHDRDASRVALTKALEALLREGAICVIITGTKIENVVDQAIRALSLKSKRSIHFCVNRGSEVFSFDDTGELVVRFQRKASNFENRSLDRAAQTLKSY